MAQAARPKLQLERPDKTTYCTDALQYLSPNINTTWTHAMCVSAGLANWMLVLGEAVEWHWEHPRPLRISRRVARSTA